MYRMLFRLVRARLGRLLAIVALATAGSAMTLAQPAAAAAPPVFMWVKITGDWGAVKTYCLDQHYEGNTPTTTVFAWTPCHAGGVNSPGNQLWRHEHLGGNIYRIMNKRGNYTWCLSAPNGNNSVVFAEHCVNSPRVPDKQRWRPVDVGGVNALQSLGTNAQCMTADLTQPNGGLVQMLDCDLWTGPGQHWSWAAP